MSVKYVVAASAKEALERAGYGAFMKAEDAAKTQASNLTHSDICDPRCTYRAYRVTFTVEEL